MFEFAINSSELIKFYLLQTNVVDTRFIIQDITHFTKHTHTQQKQRHIFKTFDISANLVKTIHMHEVHDLLKKSEIIIDIHSLFYII